MGLLVQDIVRMGETQLRNAGIKNSKREAEILYCFLMKIDRAKYILRWSKEATERETEQYLDLCQKRATRMPLQHILGEIEFMGLPFKVGEGVLVPRPETEMLVTEVMDRVKEKASVLDLCCGSGIIGISLAKLHRAKVTSVDISEKAIEYTSRNAKLNGVKINTIKSDMFAQIRKKKYNVIISNPPYIPTEEIETLEIEVKDHDPREALDGGVDGFDFYKQIIEDSPSFLKKGGLLVLEIGYNQGREMITLLEESQKFKHIVLEKDLLGFDRMLICEKL